MKYYKLVLPMGLHTKTFTTENESLTEYQHGQIVQENFVTKSFPKYFKQIKVDFIKETVERIVEVEEVVELKEVIKVEEPKEELLIETPKEVEVEIVVDEVVEDNAQDNKDAEDTEPEDAEPDYEEMTVKQLKKIASDRGIELVSTKKSDIISELK